MSVQAELDQFFCALARQNTLCRQVSEQAFAKARSKLSGDVSARLNDWLTLVATHLPHWQDFRLVAADACLLRSAIRHRHVPRSAIQLAVGLNFPGGRDDARRLTVPFAGRGWYSEIRCS
jgi:hypothetical protein